MTRNKAFKILITFSMIVTPFSCIKLFLILQYYIVLQVHGSPNNRTLSNSLQFRLVKILYIVTLN